ncbi:transglycosylase SLT domain-containing protein [Pseudomonas sp. 2FE]|uniref:transglycosylase SLT domain-containing protein n=1 Tax=Pseudomonas sp. 2FE TaxID=2502190 RepID=UPI0021141BF3|nr:transglycosylase SLT domain-containing protein [Pseudomonas sp. 2FE]
MLKRYISEDILTDIGIMQINYRWNGSRVASPELLLDPEVNIRVGAEILCESIAQFPVDMQLAIGGYHTRNPKRELDARKYASNVLDIWRSLQRLK